MDLLIKQVRLQNGGALQDVAIREEKVIKIVSVIAGNAKEVVEADGRVLIPGSVESHLRLDKALIANHKPDKSGTLKEVVEVTAKLKPALIKEDIYDRAKRALGVLIAHGTMALRTHAELDPV